MSLKLKIKSTHFFLIQIADYTHRGVQFHVLSFLYCLIHSIQFIQSRLRVWLYPCTFFLTKSDSNKQWKRTLTWRSLEQNQTVMGDFPADDKVKEGNNGQYRQMEKNSNELEDWTKQTTKQCAYTWSCSFFFHVFFNTATCGEGVYMLAKCSGYRSQCIILQHQDKLPNQRFSQPFKSNKL